MINPEDYVVMKLFQTPAGQQVCLDLSTVTGIIQESESLVLVCFGSSEVLIRTDFEKLWEQVDKAKLREASN